MSLGLAWARLQALPDPVQEQLLRPLFEVNKSEGLGPFLYASVSEAVLDEGDEGVSLTYRSVCDALLFGVLAYQTLHWLRIRDAEERKAHKWFVAWIVVLNLAETVFLMEWTCSNFVINFGSYRQFSKMNTSWTYIIDALVRTPVSAFYGERAWLLLNKNKLFGFILLLLGLSIVVLSVIMKVLATRIYASPTFQAVLYSWLICHLVLDILITTTLYAALWRQRKDGSTQTKWLISKAMYMMIETQLPPTLFSIAYMLVAGFKRGTTWPALFAFSGKIAGTCMLAVICHRYKLRSQINNSVAWVYESQSGGRS